MGSLGLSALEWSAVIRGAEERREGMCFPLFTDISISFGTVGLWCCITSFTDGGYSFQACKSAFQKTF